MRLTTRQTGIISYAGLDETALWAGAKRAFMMTDALVPERFHAFLPLFPVELVVNMSYLGPGKPMAAPSGFSIDPDEYHRALSQEHPTLYQGDNRKRNFDYDDAFRGGGAVTVDDAWANAFPQYAPFRGERLRVYLIGGGHQAVAVPESLYPRAAGLLEGVERALKITARCQHFDAYVRARLAMGEKYDPTAFEEEYLHFNALTSVCVTQQALSRAMQDLCILRDLRAGGRMRALFTEAAVRSRQVAQYRMGLRACDVFEEEPVTRVTARLVQLYNQGDGAIYDMWLPYEDASAYINRERMMLDARALCNGFQLPPAPDAQTGGARYPDRARVAVVRNHDVQPLVAEALNNPAYGDGLGPQGTLNRLVYLANSAKLLKERKLSLEHVELVCVNTDIPAARWERMLLDAQKQEAKGNLIDTMYQREHALMQMAANDPAFRSARELLNERVDEAEKALWALPGVPKEGQPSGYDADLAYLRKMWRSREGLLEPDELPFEPDAQRERAIECGYAMRAWKAVHADAADADALCTPVDKADFSQGESLAPEQDNPGTQPDEPPDAHSNAQSGAPTTQSESPADLSAQSDAQSGAPSAQEVPPAAQTDELPADQTGSPAPYAATLSKKLKKRKTLHDQYLPRFEQIDMFGAKTAAPLTELGDTPPSAPAQASAEAPAPFSAYVRRDLRRLTGSAAGTRLPAVPGKMALLVHPTQDD